MLRTASPTAVEEILVDPREALWKGTGRSPPDPSRDRSLGPIAADLDRHERMLLNLACRLTMVLDRSDSASLKRTERSILELLRRPAQPGGVTRERGYLSIIVQRRISSGPKRNNSILAV